MMGETGEWERVDFELVMKLKIWDYEVVEEVGNGGGCKQRE